jgi:hypothetical protein
MSYVIQNFYLPARLVVNTPRFKNALLLINLPKLFFFYKLNIKILEKK